MTRSAFLALTLTAAVSLVGPVPGSAQPTAGQPAKPNVILIMTDDQGYGDMSCHGNPYLKTPNLDRLHRDSVRLTDFHVDPTCSPTRAALMTGRYSSRVGRNERSAVPATPGSVETECRNGVADAPCCRPTGLPLAANVRERTVQ